MVKLQDVVDLDFKLRVREFPIAWLIDFWPKNSKRPQLHPDWNILAHRMGLNLKGLKGFENFVKKKKLVYKL